MRWTILAWLYLVEAAAGWLSNEDLARFRPERRRPRPRANPEKIFRRQSEARYLNSKTAPFAVNGTGIPDVDFDIGESYAGQLPVGNSTDQNMFFWFFPTVSTNATAQKDILVWLNGGPGCSSLEGLIQENGPFLWQYGTYRPVANPWSWHRLTNVVYIDQPIGTGFSTGNVTANSEDDVAVQFLGFWRNFIELFAMQGYNVYLSGESYAGQYCPYIGQHMLAAEDKSHFNLQGMMINDPAIGNPDLSQSIPVVAFMDYHRNLHPFNDSFVQYMHQTAATCGWTSYLDTYLVYPPAKTQPSRLPDEGADGLPLPACGQLGGDIFEAAQWLNPCWDVYNVAQTCPEQWDVLGFPGTNTYLPAGATIYFNRSDVKAAIHAPQSIEWNECSGPVFAIGDFSPPSAFSQLPTVIDRTKNVIIAHGALDFVLLANGTLLAIQNMTWGGRMGFQARPTEPFYVPYNDDQDMATLAGSGVFGTAHSERGLTYVGVDLSGHMIPQYAPGAAFRMLEVLLGRVSSLQSRAPFTVDGAAPQSVSQMGLGTAPQGWSGTSRTSRAVGRRVVMMN